MSKLVETLKAYGCKVSDGMLLKEGTYRVHRNKRIVMDGLKISSLKSFAKEVEVIKSGNDCGISFEGSFELIKGDTIECVQKNS